MRIVVCRGAFTARADRALHLEELFSVVIRRRHDVLVHPDAEELWLAWLRATSPVLATTFHRVVQDSHSRQALAPSAMEVHIADPDASDWDQDPPSLHVLDALDLLNLPLEILVEDETSDGAFLDAVVPPPLQGAWKQARHERRVRPITLGGVTHVPRRLAGHRVDPPLCKRSFVLIDSDAPRPWVVSGRPREECWDALPRDVERAARAARSVQIPVEVLERRMAESYLPPAALRAWVASLPAHEQFGKRPHVEAFESLPDRCKHHHHLKNGLKPAERSNYGELSDAAELALSFSLGSNTWQAFHHARAVDLHAYGVHAELAPLFQQLLRLV